MKFQHNEKSFLRRALAAALILVLLLAILPARAVDSEETYIVSYKDEAVQTMEDDGLPFDVVDRTELECLLADDLVAWYEEDGCATLLDPEPEADLLGSLSPYYADIQWSLRLIGADAAFEKNYLGQGVRVGVIDSGVAEHADLRGNLLQGHNYTLGASDPNDTTDQFGHGTKVAGLIAASGSTGYIGAAPAAWIVPLKCTDSKTVRISTICEAIYGGIDDYHCDVLNLSLGTETEYQSLREAVEYAEAQGVVVVSAGGNGGTAARFYPAGFESVIGVGAVDRSSYVYYRSNHNDSIFLTAPGVNVRSTYYLGGYISDTGTSFSAPQVSGAAAVLMGMDGSLLPCEVRDLLKQSAKDQLPEGYDEYYGYGILDVGGCVTALEERKTEQSIPCAFLPLAGVATAVRNYTEETCDCRYILAQYGESGQCLSVTARDLIIPPGEAVTLEPVAQDQIIVQYLCDKDTMAPLAVERRTPASVGELNRP